MRAINLKLKAFGPFRDEINIDFDKFGKDGLFLISGQTGAGKTSIFDAISYALFGMSSGGQRDERMLQNTSSKEKETTFVDLKFEYKKEIYQIYRDFVLKERKKTKKIDVVKSAWIKLPNGDMIDGITNTNKYIETLLGINKEQYNQISMLAQGDFMKLLKASSEKKKELFRDIFQTQNYDLLDKNIYKKLKDSASFLKTLSTTRDEIYSNIKIYEQSKEEYIKAKAIGIEEVISFTKDINKQFENEKFLLNKDIEKYSNKYDERKILVEKVENFLDIKNKIKINQKTLEDLLSKYEKYKNKYENLNAIEDDKQKVIEEINSIQKKLKLFDTLENIQKEKKNIESKIDENNKKLEDIIKNIDKLIIEKEEKKKYLLENKKAKTIQSEINIELRSNEDRRDEIKLLIKNISEIERSYDKKSLFEDRYHTKKEEFYEKNNIFNTLSDLYFESQAGILASKLEENAPCPVCGSTNHPSIAKITNNAPTKEKLELEKIELENIRSEKEKIQSEITRINAIIQENIKIKNDRLEKLNIDENEIFEYKNQIISRIEFLEKKFKKLDDIISNIDKYEKDIEDIEKAISNFNLQRENLTIYINVEKQNLLNLEKREKEELSKLDNLDKEALEKNLKKLDEEKNKLNNDILDIKGKYQDYSTKFTSIKASIKTLEENLDPKYDIDLQSIKIEILSIKTSLDNVRSKFNIFDSNIRENAIQINKLNDIKKDFDIQLNLYNDLKDLSETLRGQLKGVKNVKFETFVQFRYFNEILNASNKRFYEMTYGKYTLKRKEEANNLNEQTGLDFEVFDHHNKTRRNINTLSGGESFQAALSLALGLSDVVQKNAGGIQLDSMYVDEGFGTLDKDTLSKVMSTLSKISSSNKLIGIISHVETLKEQIDKKIILEKTLDGYSIIRDIIY